MSLGHMKFWKGKLTMSMATDVETLNTQEALKELGISRKTLYKWMGRGMIRPINYNPLFERQIRLLFARADIEALKHMMQPTELATPA